VRCNQNIKGFTEALTHMPAGSVWEVYIPQELIARQGGSVFEPFSLVIYTVELIGIE
jgi:FKBP-type peptidyl-prolyl cis-trans isomerase FklB